jgi:histidinol phosphatase-like PHP family hydrolase
MIDVRKSDYHVHYYADACAHAEMTLANIEREAIELGLAEVCVVKHYSRELPNGDASWVHWKRVVPDQFTAFLEDFRSHKSTGRVRLLSGVETELLDDTGQVNIPVAEAMKLDAAILSVHWLPRMEVISADPVLVPGSIEKGPSDIVTAWKERIAACGTEAILENFVSAYVHAINKNPKVLVLGHMFDGLLPLRSYGVPVDGLSDDRLIGLMEPLMVACADRGVLWELTPGPVKRTAILEKANRLGVRFCATADAHFLHEEGWAHLRDHAKAEKYLSLLGLTSGNLRQRG